VGDDSLANGSLVPLKVTARVPEPVTGEPETLRNAGTDIATLVTVPPLVPLPVFVTH